MASAFANALLAGRVPIIMEVKRSDGEGAELIGERTIAGIVEQNVAAKEMGASAVLLTAKILPAKTFQHLIELTLEHGLTPFVEVVDQGELESVIHPADCIIAVNNKDINTRAREPADF